MTINPKIGDYLGTKSIERMLAWTHLTIDCIIAIDHGVCTVEYFDTRDGIRRITYYIRIDYDDVRILSENVPQEKILIDRFKTAQMQYVLEM